ncbi:hypothetical protein [Streptomyces hydrogenans]|uniref:hypothetical protein n=1 Tax=Streptomyces hydrogenans TaxID=1873719 RepID=UPI00278BAE5A|nr:hypothetical protein [Streptomyces hydrogenans]
MTLFRWAIRTGQAGNPAGAVDTLRKLAEDETRVYGSREHDEVQDTLAELERWQAIFDDEAST